MTKLPKILVRLDDGAEFVLDENTRTYSLPLNMPNYVGHQYTYERLMEDPRSKGSFASADDISDEDIQTMKQNWIKQFENRNDGHGNEDE